MVLIARVLGFAKPPIVGRKAKTAQADGRRRHAWLGRGEINFPSPEIARAEREYGWPGSDEVLLELAVSLAGLAGSRHG